MSDRIKEAEECIKKAEKYLKTSILSLKFKPEWDSAATEYDRAAICYKNAKKLQECREMHLKGSKCYEESGSLYHAAKCKEQAAMVSRDLGDMDRARELMEAAAEQYGETGSPETSAMAMDKAGKFFEPFDTEKAIEIYEKAYTVVSGTDRTRQATDFLNRLTRLYCKQEKLEEAAGSIQRNIDIYHETRDAGKVGQLTSGLVLVRLSLGDSIEANKAFQRGFNTPGYEETEDCKVIPHLIRAYESGDNQKLQVALTYFKGMANEFLRLMKKLKPPMVEKKSPDEEEGEAVDEEELDLR